RRRLRDEPFPWVVEERERIDDVVAGNPVRIRNAAMRAGVREEARLRCGIPGVTECVRAAHGYRDLVIPDHERVAMIQRYSSAFRQLPAVDERAVRAAEIGEHITAGLERYGRMTARHDLLRVGKNPIIPRCTPDRPSTFEDAGGIGAHGLALIA